MPTTFANTIDGNEILAKRSQCDYAGNDLQTTYATKSEVTTGLASKENSANKAQSINTSSTTDFPSSKATADFVNSSVATNTAKFLGNFTLTDLSLTYPATDAQIETALDGYTFSPAPTNNDYVYVEIQNPQTPGVTDVVKRFKFDGTSWLYEYSLNNSSFTAAEIAAIDSGVTSAKVTAYDAHVADSDIHVTLSDKSTWNAKQDAISDLATIRSGASAGATAVQPGDLSTVATTGAYSDLTGTPTIPSGVQLVPAATSADADKVLTVDAQGIPDWAVIPAQSTGLFQAEYGTTSYADIVQAINDKKIVYCRLNSGASRMAFLAYIGSSNVEFQYYRSLSSHSAANMTDEVYVYTVSSSGWTTTTRKTGAKVVAGTHMSQSYSNDTLTLNADWPDVDQTYDASSSNAQSGVAIAGELAGIEQVPAVTSSDDGKVLKATYSGGAGTYAWDTETDTTYSAGNMISIDPNSNNAIGVLTTAGITDVQQVNSLPAQTVPTVLYLIPET